MARKETMAERKYCKMKKISIQNIAQLSSWTQLLVTNSLAVQQNALTKQFEFEGETYPLIRVEISSDSHPFYTGRQKFTQADGRVDRFNKKYGLK